MTETPAKKTLRVPLAPPRPGRPLRVRSGHAFGAEQFLFKDSEPSNDSRWRVMPESQVDATTLGTFLTTGVSANGKK